MKLTHTEKLFIAEYLRNGQNGTGAYLVIRPNITERSASVCANRLLKKPAVTEAINRAVDKRFDDSIAKKEYLITEADEIGKEARQEKSFGSALKAVELKAKLNKVFDEDTSGAEGYSKLIQFLTINVDSSDKGEKAIDVTPQIENKE